MELCVLPMGEEVLMLWMESELGARFCVATDEESSRVGK